MERTINIDGRDVKFRSSGAFPMLYRSYTNHDLFADFARMGDAIREEDGKTVVDFDKLDTRILADAIWCAAKCADKTIAPQIEWYDTFDEFPLFDVFAQLNDLIMSSMQTIKKSTAAKA